MPFKAFNSSFSLPETVFDFTIIGAGAAGICLAVNLSKQGKRVMLIESGSIDLQAKYQVLNKVISTGKKMNGITDGRKRAIGGTTIAWGGQSLPFSPIDFEKREWLNNSGWPISYEDIYPYYAEANDFMGITSNHYYGEEALIEIKLKNPGFDENIFDYHTSKWAEEPNFKKRYQDYLETNVFVLYHATLNDIVLEKNSIKNIEVVNFEKNSLNIPVKNLIIAAGGIESNRILLSYPQLCELYKNHHLVGKGFMDHPCLDIGEIITKDEFRLQQYFSTHLYKKMKTSIRLSLSRNWQQKKQVLNGSVCLFFELDSNLNIYHKIKRLKYQWSTHTLYGILRNMGKLSKSLYAYLVKSFIYKPGARAIISLMVEQESIPLSHITLADELDNLDQKKVQVNWDIGFTTWSTIITISDNLKNEFERLNFGKVNYNENITIDNKDWKELLSDVNHHMGGCKMSDTPEAGIVDKNLKIWGIDNAFVASAAVFPTASHSNPTLTLLALCQRLSTYLNNVHES
ncbi:MULTISPECIES: GMC oxidoreductase [unclassified Pedobacter]|uniref:GMC oxidoreductase n=1 Tax=unclassified Pedobacter TaxID=2628915 RepID=UPI0014233708|nr:MULTISPECIES: GMC oxidoreductase [unclassified Pedobacter]NII81324.1 choline dehydrogenase-like flavoprotein [Pedobacter sp. SG908]NMN35330.1 choline dehydrogenase-like flavoprotein [Pedobacter sp. SG918]